MRELRITHDKYMRPTKTDEPNTSAGFDEINLFRFFKMNLHFTRNVAMWSRA